MDTESLPAPYPGLPEQAMMAPGTHDSLNLVFQMLSPSVQADLHTVPEVVHCVAALIGGDLGVYLDISNFEVDGVLWLTDVGTH